ncbi:MAG: hypothetical protein OXE58_00905 [Acidobacteria bacterium]|nr:hypothetical protein [Acidobacteriota bacterium]
MTPVERARIWLYSAPAYAAGYVEGETIRLVAEFEERVSVAGLPRMAIEIGEAIRLAGFSPWVEDDWPPERPSFRQRFEYVIRAEDRDEDGIRIPSDPFDFAEGAFVNSAGVEVEVEIYSVTPTRADALGDPGEPLGSHRVAGTLAVTHAPRECTDERRDRTLAYGAILPAEWDGTAILVRFLDPEIEEQREDLAHEIENVALLADQIEEQVGYRILDVDRTLIPRAEANRAMAKVTQDHDAWGAMQPVAYSGPRLRVRRGLLTFTVRMVGRRGGSPMRRVHVLRWRGGASLRTHDTARTVSPVRLQAPSESWGANQPGGGRHLHVVAAQRRRLGSNAPGATPRSDLRGHRCAAVRVSPVDCGGLTATGPEPMLVSGRGAA